MNHSIRSADRSTHLKIVVMALITAIAMTALAIGSRVEAPAATAGVIKAGQPVTMTGLTVVVTR
ncbi:hypothetical protein [Bradyrhizobium sp.]|uniref:hypothetical protein n=1 Tax=Bradyrhizobium sp. TaxID=376 RepID=UPI001DEA102B|nr:hypothetical protein [Bradyrhizobium sp.]MBI5322541.1 hypothetical protein [Bradyrhizobium sp.]